MNENINLSNYSVSIRINNNIEHLTMDTFAVICDRFLFEELLDFIAQSPVGTIVYSGYRNKSRYFIHINPKEV